MRLRRRARDNCDAIARGGLLARDFDRQLLNSREQLTERQRKLESGEIMQIGVNAFTGEIGLTPAPKQNRGPRRAGDQGKRAYRVDRQMACGAR